MTLLVISAEQHEGPLRPSRRPSGGMAQSTELWHGAADREVAWCSQPSGDMAQPTEWWHGAADRLVAWRSRPSGSMALPTEW